MRLDKLIDILGTINTLNQQLQGKGSLIIDSVDKSKAVISVIENWRSKVGMENLGMLEIVLEIVGV